MTTEESTACLQMNQLLLRNDRFKSKASETLAVIAEEFIECAFKWIKENRLDLETPRSRPIMPKNLPAHWFVSNWKWIPMHQSTPSLDFIGKS
jgi:hypothetical protein